MTSAISPEGAGCPICDNHKRVLRGETLAWVPCPGCEGARVCPDCHGRGEYPVLVDEWEPCPCTDPTDAAHNYREAPNHA